MQDDSHPVFRALSLCILGPFPNSHSLATCIRNTFKSHSECTLALSLTPTTMSVTQTPRFTHSEDFEQPTYFFAPDDEILRDWLDTDTIVNSIIDLSPVNTLSDLADITPEEEFEGNYSPMPHSLRRVLTPPLECDESCSRRRSILFESSMPSSPGMPSYSRYRSEYLRPPMHRARQSVSSIASCSTVYTKTAPTQVKSILTRHDSGISLATTKTSRKKKRSPPSVKFVEAPMVYHGHSPIPSPPHSPPATSSGRRKKEPRRWFARWWKPNPPPRPTISGPYSLARTASLVDVYSSRSKPTQCGRLKRFWVRVTSAVR
ncbi:hypothetical protein DEU56DRAFT_829275 [Suillus clintonianus]|uniref:uncharacterized protein n=1 Tax=Suillus clintonianus TaxID=1904413 RepID=UPI001B85C8F1|nr:uncharacterized protein DEU56DRAFT_829275 [Suillus clintonianus]KAG2123588.1 hypothetical protein DEU56DRAFT_829275 [Suillus clintonianus]